jgi:hypothetical protein
MSCACAEICQCPYNPVIAPILVLLGHADDQLLDLAADPRPTRASTSLRAIEFAGHHLAVPGQDGVWSGHVRHLGENLAAQAMTDLPQRGSLGVAELQPPFQPGASGCDFQRPDIRSAPAVPGPPCQSRRPGCAPNPLYPPSFGCGKTVAGEVRRGYAEDAQIPVLSKLSIF